MFDPITVTSIALGHALTRPLSKDYGWQPVAASTVTYLMPTEHAIISSRAVGLSATKASFASLDRLMSRLEWLNAELLAYQDLEAGWDGDESEPPKHEHISAAASLLKALPAGLPLPKTMISADGEVGLYWKDDRWLADAVIEDKDHFSLFIRSLKDGNREIFVDSIAIGTGASQIIHETFAKM
jgi:hypothetical protein